MRVAFFLLLVAIPMIGTQRDWKKATLVEITRIAPTKTSGMTTNQAYTLDLGDRTIVVFRPGDELDANQSGKGHRRISDPVYSG
jgi:hypothetical protein